MSGLAGAQFRRNQDAAGGPVSTRRLPRWLSASWPGLIAGALVALPWLPSPLFLDDWHLLQRAHDTPWTWHGLVHAFTFLDWRSIESWNLPARAPYTYFRPLTVASFKLDLALFGPSPIAMHLVNLALHLGSVALVAAIALRIGRDLRTARLAALLFAIQPQDTVAVIWTAGRTEVLTTTLILAAFLAWLIAREERRVGWLGVAIGLQALACLAKETAVLLAAGIIAWEIAQRIAGGLHPAPDTLAQDPLIPSAVEGGAVQAGHVGGQVSPTPQQYPDTDVSGSKWSTGRARDRLRDALVWDAPVLAVAVAYTLWRLAYFDPGSTLTQPYYLSPASAGFASFFGTKILYQLFSLFTTAFVVPVLGVQLLRAHLVALVAVVLIVVLGLVLLLRGHGRDPLTWLGLLWLGASLLPTAPLPAIDLYLYFGSIGFAFAAAAALVGARGSTSDASPALPRKGYPLRSGSDPAPFSCGTGVLARERLADATTPRGSPWPSTGGDACATGEEPALSLSEADSPVPRWRRRLVAVIAVVYVVGFVGRAIFYRQEGVISERVTASIRQDAPLAQGSLLLMVNLPFAAAHVAPMLRLTGGPHDVRAMLVTVATQWGMPTWRARVVCQDDRHVRILPPPEQGAFFATPEEWNLQLMRRPLDPAMTWYTDGVHVRPDWQHGRVVALDLAFDRPLTEGKDRIYVVYDDGHRVAHWRCGPGTRWAGR